MKVLKTFFVVLLGLFLLGLIGMIAYFELRTPGKTGPMYDPDIVDAISFSAGR